MPEYLHARKDFPELLRIVAAEKKDTACIGGKGLLANACFVRVQQPGNDFELKGGTSLSKGYQLIQRFSEDLDLHIHPPAAMGINENPNNCKAATVEARKKFYDWLAENLQIEARDHTFDDLKCYCSGGIRLSKIK